MQGSFMGMLALGKEKICSMKGPSILERFRDLADKLSYRQYLMIGALCSILLGVMIYFVMDDGAGNRAEKDRSVQTSMVSVVVANQDIPQRTVVKAEMLRTVEVPSNAVPAGAVKDIQSAVNKPAAVMILQGDVVTEKKLLADLRMAGFIGMIPPDCRAISISINDVTGVAGFAKPGDYVDVMLINGKNNNGRVSGEILLQNVLLLGLNKTANVHQAGAPKPEVKKEDGKEKEGEGEENKEKKNENPSNDVKASGEAMATATLAITPEEALKLAVASQQGTVYLLLRPYKPRDMFVLDTEYFQLVAPEKKEAQPAPMPQIPMPSFNMPAPAAPAAPAAPSASNNYGVKVFRGTEEGK